MIGKNNSFGVKNLQHFGKTCVFGIFVNVITTLSFKTLTNQARILRYCETFVKSLCSKIMTHVKYYNKVQCNYFH
jgi:hypothetical protein